MLTIGLCYLGTDGTALAFETGEMGGEAQIITAVRLFRSKNFYRFGDHCVPTKNVSKKLSFESGLGLGTTEGKIIEDRGSPSKKTSNSVHYVYQTTQKTSARNEDSLTTLEIYVANQELSEISISRVVEVY